MQLGLTVKESIQHVVINEFLESHLPLDEACRRLGLHRSSFWRKCRRYAQEGPLGLVHKLRGQSSNSSHDLSLKEALLTLYANDYLPFGFRVAHFYQEAQKDFPQPVGYSTLVRWFTEAGLIQKTHKGWKHHSRRPRRSAFGEMLQMDTSIHDWLDCGNNMALISNMDDATNVLTGAYLTASDTTLGNMTVLKQTLTTHGLFASLYVDRAPVFKVTRTGGLGRIVQPTHEAPYITQIQRALNELGIELIYAYSPQAKGRIERSFGTWQSRLIPELKKNGIKEPDKANAYIQQVYLPKHNNLFAQDPKKYPKAFVPLPEINLDRILCEKHHLTISNDHIVSSKQAGLHLKILPSKHRLSYAKAKVEVLKHIDGSVSVLYKKEKLNFVPYP